MAVHSVNSSISELSFSAIISHCNSVRLHSEVKIISHNECVSAYVSTCKILTTGIRSASVNFYLIC